MQDWGFKIPNLEKRNKEVDLDHSARAVKYLNIHTNKIKNIEQLVPTLPEWDDIYFLQTRGSFNAFTFIPFIIKHKCKIDELWAVTYSINKRVIESLLALHNNGCIGKITLLVSDSLLKRNPATCELLNSIAINTKAWHVIYSWTHCKYTLAKCGDSHFVVEGSGNWSENAQYEQYSFANNSKLYLFRKRLFNECKIRFEAK